MTENEANPNSERRVWYRLEFWPEVFFLPEEILDVALEIRLDAVGSCSVH